MIKLPIFAKILIIMRNKKFSRDRDFLKFPNRMRDQKTSANDFRASAKLVYIFILYMQEYDEDFSPSHQFMERRFGISQPTYSKSIIALEKLGYIEVIRSSNMRHRNKINVIWKNIDSLMFTMIPHCIINTDVYTNDQKLFLILLMSFSATSDTRRQFSAKTVADIYNFMREVGFGLNAIHSRIKELSRPDSGFINCIDVCEDGIYINMDALFNISERCFEMFSLAVNNGKKYAIYEKPKKGEFYFDPEKRRIIKRKNGNN